MDLLNLDRLSKARAEAAARVEYLSGMTAHSKDGVERVAHKQSMEEAKAEYAAAEAAYQSATATLSDSDLRALMRREQERAA